jgi:hypothetical protein
MSKSVNIHPRLYDIIEKLLKQIDVEYAATGHASGVLMLDAPWPTVYLCRTDPSQNEFAKPFVVLSISLHQNSVASGVYLTFPNSKNWRRRHHDIPCSSSPFYMEISTNETVDR